jgi:hypothetical protein
MATTEDAYDAIPVTIPSTITAAGLKAAKAAIPVWRNAVRLYDESMQDPSGNWEAKMRKYVGDPAAITQLSLVSALAHDGMHQIGDTRFDARVIVATANNVQIQACIDTTRLDVVNADGASITGGSHRRRVRHCARGRVGCGGRGARGEREHGRGQCGCDQSLHRFVTSPLAMEVCP